MGFFGERGIRARWFNWRFFLDVEICFLMLAYVGFGLGFVFQCFRLLERVVGFGVARAFCAFRCIVSVCAS